MSAHLLVYLLAGALVATPIGQTAAARAHGDAGAQASFVQTLEKNVRLDLAFSQSAKAGVYASDATVRAKEAATDAKDGNQAGTKLSAQAYEKDMILASLDGGSRLAARAAASGTTNASALSGQARADLLAGARASHLSKQDLELTLALQNKTHLSLPSILNLHLSGKSWGDISALAAK